MSNARFIHLIWSLNHGGAERFLLDIIKNNVLTSNSVILCLRRGRLDCNEFVHVYYGVRALIYMIKILISDRKAYILCWMYRSSLLFAPFATICRLKKNIKSAYLIRHTIPNERLDYREIINKLIYKCTYLMYDKILFNSLKSKLSHIGKAIDSNKYGILYNYYVARSIGPKNPILSGFKKSQVILYPCREHPMKGFDFLLEVVKSFPIESPLICVIVGDDPCETRKRKITELAKTNPNCAVRYSPSNQDLATMLPYVEVVLSTSLYGESFPNLGLDARHFGCKFVASDVGDTALLTRKEWIYNPGSVQGCITALKDAISYTGVLNTELDFSVDKFKKTFFQEMGVCEI